MRGQNEGAVKEGMAAMQEAPPPKDFSVAQIANWLQGLKGSPDEKALHLLIEQIDVQSKTDINISSTLTSVLGETGWSEMAGLGK